MKKKCTETDVAGPKAAPIGEKTEAAEPREKKSPRVDVSHTYRKAAASPGDPRAVNDVHRSVVGEDSPPITQPCLDGRIPDDAVFRDIIKKATEGNIKYQELYLKYINLISAKTADEDEVIYEATFVDDKDKET